jgi:site-specific DNA recombinase
LADPLSWIFAEFIGGKGIFAVAEGLTRNGIARPSQHDRERGGPRAGIAWSKGAVRAILTNPCYPGYQEWNRQGTDEVLIDVENVALGHAQKMLCNPEEKWGIAERLAHPPITGKEDCELARATLAGRGSKTQHRQHARNRVCPLREACPTGCAGGG